MHIFLSSVQGIPGLQTAQGAGAAQQQNVVMVQPSQNITSMTSSPVAAASNACKFVLKKLDCTNAAFRKHNMFASFSTKCCNRHTSNGQCI